MLKKAINYIQIHGYNITYRATISYKVCSNFHNGISKEGYIFTLFSFRINKA